MDLGIADKVAFVAGGSKGMGLAAARLLAAEGCRVAIVARSAPSIDEAVEAIRSQGGEAMGVVADLTDGAAVAGAVATVTDAYGSPDIVVGQTNDMTAGALYDTRVEDYERVFRTFTMAQVYLARATLPAMQAKGWGRYIHIGAVSGKEPSLTRPHILSNTVRPSTVAFLRVVANEVARDGVTVNVVAPGLTATPTLQYYIRDRLGLTEAEGEAWLAGDVPAHIAGGQGPENIPMGRAGKAEEVAGLVVFLASRDAGYITGEWIAVDGGRHRFSF